MSRPRPTHKFSNGQNAFKSTIQGRKLSSGETPGFPLPPLPTNLCQEPTTRKRQKIIGQSSVPTITLSSIVQDSTNAQQPFNAWSAHIPNIPSRPVAQQPTSYYRACTTQSGPGVERRTAVLPPISTNGHDFFRYSGATMAGQFQTTVPLSTQDRESSLIPCSSIFAASSSNVDNVTARYSPPGNQNEYLLRSKTTNYEVTRTVKTKGNERIAYGVLPTPTNQTDQHMNSESNNCDCQHISIYNSPATAQAEIETFSTPSNRVCNMLNGNLPSESAMHSTMPSVSSRNVWNALSSRKETEVVHITPLSSIGNDGPRGELREGPMIFSSPTEVGLTPLPPRGFSIRSLLSTQGREGIDNQMDEKRRAANEGDHPNA